MAAEKCPHCGRGRQVEHGYEFAGVIRDDSYCGTCGRRWPFTGPVEELTVTAPGEVVVPERHRAPKPQPAPVDLSPATIRKRLLGDRLDDTEFDARMAAAGRDDD